MPNELKPYKKLAVEILEEFTNCFSEADEDVLARMIRDSGFRKASDVAREIFAEIEYLIWQYDTRPASDLTEEIAELKKKYESEGADDEH